MRPSSSPSSGTFRAVAQARARARERPRRSAPRVLVAEDDLELRRIVVEALRKDGYETREATDGGRLLVELTTRYLEDAIELDLIISDIRMPICTGLDIVEALRRARCAVPVILMTAFGDDETRRRADALGAVLFDKPFAMDDLRTAVTNLAPRG